ncbi:MAG: ATP-binding protein [Xanthomonadales bacterium]|nr:ATP-binding protein [Xanthomonadales bacterium]
MLKYLNLKNLGLAPDLRLDLAPRLNLITGDNGLGKSFLLDLAWWALTRTWAGSAALPPLSARHPQIEYVVQGKAGEAKPVVSRFRRTDETWPVDAKRPPMPGVVVYIRIDGGFSVWDPARNYWRNDPGRPAAYHFASSEVWEGLDVRGQRVCEGLERDWINWQEGRKPQFRVLEEVLRVLSPVAETLRAGAPQRLFLGEGRDRPTLLIGSQTVPVALASAGVRRVLALAYFLVWAWHEHQVAAGLLGKKPESRVVILFDEPETHLHPRWQRTIVPSVLAAVDALRGKSDAPPQVLLASHSPLVAASLEPLFDRDQDDVARLEIQDGVVTIEQGAWAPQGDAANWLVSETFGLEQARSLDAERAIEAAEAFMRGDLGVLPKGLDSKPAIHNALSRLLPAHDHFWPRWVVSTQPLPGKQAARR